MVNAMHYSEAAADDIPKMLALLVAEVQEMKKLLEEQGRRDRLAEKSGSRAVRR